LNDEKIDVIEWNPDPATFIAKALSPARVSGVFLDEDPDRGKTAMVVVPEDQLSLAIGRAGVNARLGARLTGWRIDIKSLTEAASESLQRLQTSEEYAEQAVQEEEVMPQVETILAKKAEGRPVMPEEYQTLSGFVNRIQQEIHGRRQSERMERLARLAEIREQIPVMAYETPLEEIGLKTRVFNLLDEAGFSTAGQVLEQIHIDEDKILGLQGFGPKSMREARETLEGFDYPEPVVEEIEEEPEEVEEEVEVEAVAEAPEEEVAEEVEIAEAVEPEEEVVEEIPAVEAVVEAEAEEVEEPAEVVPEEIDEAEIIETAAALFSETVVEDADEERLEELDEELDREAKRDRERRRVVEFDPELGEMIVKRRRKRDQEDWEDFKG
jgi:N utilization substance protein A